MKRRRLVDKYLLKYNTPAQILRHILARLTTVLMGDYRYHELRRLISYFPCHWVVPADFPNTCPMKIVRIFYRINARYGRDIYTLTQSFPNQQWHNKSTYDLVERFLFPLSFYRWYIKFKERYSDVSTFRMIFNSIHLSSI